MRTVNLVACLGLAMLATSCAEDDDLFVICPYTCYTGPSGTEGVGACRSGTPVCDDSGEVIECNGEVLPKYERGCDTVDADCDGNVQDSPSIGPDDPDNQCAQCGKCRRTREVCDGETGQWYCAYVEGPPAADDSTCDGVDDDCDCTKDEDVYPDGEVVFCYRGPEGTALNGECRPGIEACIDGETVCDGEVTPTDERCNEKDDDCNGFTDDVTTFYDYVAMLIAIDISGSMGDEIEAVTSVICDYASQGGNESYKFGLVLIASPDGHFSLVQNVTDAAGLCVALQNVVMNGGSEPTLSTVEAVTDPTNPLMIDWPENSKRIFVGFGDENGQVESGSIDDAITNTLAYCDASETDVYWFVQHPDDYFETALGCNGYVFQLTSYEPWMLDDMNSIIEGVCLEASP